MKLLSAGPCALHCTAVLGQPVEIWKILSLSHLLSEILAVVSLDFMELLENENVGDNSGEYFCA